MNEQEMNKSDEEWWAKWEEKMKKIEKMEKQLGVDRDSIVTKEEYDWVEEELKQCDKLYDEMYGKEM
jgi:hypothetical protein